MRDKRDDLKRSDVDEIMEFANTLVTCSRSIVLEYQIEGSEIQTKEAAGEPITRLDIIVERLWTDKIKKRYPEHSIVGEETGFDNNDSDLTWVLDPIDGTDDLIRNSPLYGSIIAVLYKGEPVVGVIDHPKLNLCCHAKYGSKAIANGTEIQSIDSFARDIREAVVMPAYDDFRKLDKCDEIIAAIGREIPNQRIYRNVYGHTMVALGKFAAALEVDVALWDVAATQLLVEQANGKFVIFRDTGGDYGERRFGAIFGRTTVVDRLSLIVSHFV